MIYQQLRVLLRFPLVIILSWLYNKSGRFIQASALFHASMNTLPFVFPHYAPGFGLLFVIAAYAIFCRLHVAQAQSRVHDCCYWQGNWPLKRHRQRAEIVTSATPDHM
jgi:hypothetical protein